MTDKDSFMVFSGTATRYLAEKICASLGCKLGNLQITKFSDGEFAVSYEGASVVATCSSYRAHSLAQTISWSFFL